MLKKTLRTSLRATHSEQDLKKWFDPLLLRQGREGELEVHFPHALFAGWFDAEKRTLLERELARALGRSVAVSYCAPGGTVRAAPLPLEKKSGTPLARTGDSCSFENFICNKKNEFPLAMARKVALDPANKSYFPFVICGKGTCGKTHMLRATARAMASGGAARAMYLGSVEDLSASHPGIGGSAARQRISGYEALFLDDAQRLSEHPALQQELIYLADHFRDRGKPLVLAFDEELDKTGISDRLRSRLEAGLVVTLKKPDLDIRLRYVLAETARLGQALSKEQALSLAQRFHDLRLLSGIMNKISAFCATNACALNDTDLEKLLSHSAESASQSITPESIINAVAEHFSLPPALILGSRRQPDIVQARQISMFLCRDLLGLSFPALGEIFGGKNHATVVYAYKKIQKLQEGDSTMNSLVTAIRKKCVTRRG